MDASMQAFIIAILVALPAILTALAGFVLVIRKITEVHQIVNSQRELMQREIESLKEIISDRRIADLIAENEHLEKRISKGAGL